jgi:5-hydroxyisourate hydrolase
MPGISTHILDTANGRPAAGVPVVLEMRGGGDWAEVASATTDSDGRVAELLEGPLEAGDYRIRFATGGYLGGGAFFPEVTVTFTVTAPDEHHHVPLLLSPFGYATYRGS